MKKPIIITMDFESVLVPEVWMEVAKNTGIKELQLTTRDITDYDELMRTRIKILSENNLKLEDVQKVIKNMEPLKGALEFLNWIRQSYPLVILSDTYYEFAWPLIKKLNYPNLFCHSLEIDNTGRITNYFLRKSGTKQDVVKAFKNLGFFTVAIGDSYNDVDMLQEANRGLFLHASEKVKEDFSNILAFKNYRELKNYIITSL